MKKKIIVIAIILIILIWGIYYFINNKKKDIGFKVPNYYVMELANYEDKKEAFEEKYNWYKNVENNEGIYLINTTYFSKEILKEYKKYNVYKNIPLKDFWYFAVSPNYLDKMNINVSDDLIENAKNGIRVFLIPETYSENEINAMKSYLKENDERVFDDDAVRKPEETISTNYYNDPKIEFVIYTPNKEYFTFPSSDKVSLVEKAPVIFICTTNNMTYFESESLFATGINSYIKFENKEILNKYKDNKILIKNNVEFKKLSEVYKSNGKIGLVDKGIDGVFED